MYVNTSISLAPARSMYYFLLMGGFHLYNLLAFFQEVQSEATSQNHSVGLSARYIEISGVNTLTVVIYSEFHRHSLTLVIHHPLTPSFQALNLPFLQILPTVAFLFFFRTGSTDSPECLPTLLCISIFFTFTFFSFLVVGSVRRVPAIDLRRFQCRLLSAH